MSVVIIVSAWVAGTLLWGVVLRGIVRTYLCNVVADSGWRHETDKAVKKAHMRGGLEILIGGVGTESTGAPSAVSIPIVYFIRGPFFYCSITFLAAVAPGACGGTAVVDGSGGGGSGANSGAGGGGAAGATSAVGTTVTASTTASAAVSSSSGGQTDCDLLEGQMVAAYAAAVACDPSIDVEQCTGTTLGKYYCGCEVVANDQLPEEAALSLKLGTQWWEACEYNFCESGCYPTDAPWYCDPNTNRCAPAFE